ncbi:MAG: helix-turn-helix domain-containing protein [Acidimicrobiales bacterium]
MGTEPKRDLLLHAIRLRIVQALVNQPLTPAGLSELLGDVAPATLYRHINQLHAGGLIEVVEQRQVRGGTERTFGVVQGAGSLDEADLDGVGSDEHFRYFATFVGTLLGDYAAYLRNAESETQADLQANFQPDFEADGVGYRQVALWLDDEEFEELTNELRAALASRLDRQPAPGRRRRLVTSILMPDDRGTPDQDQDSGQNPDPAQNHGEAGKA